MISRLETFLDEILKIRVTEEFIAKEFFDQKIFSFLHLMQGQEASPVGVCMALQKKDICLGNHRSHGHYLAKGGNLEKMVYEVFGDTRGCCKGYGGSMHMLDRSVNFNGSTPILGSIPSLAVGQSYASKFNGKNNVTVVFLGDGSAEEGIFMESVNLAANKKCQIIFVLEDNRYSVASSHADRKSKRYSFKKLYEGLGANYINSSGQDVWKVFKSAQKARSIASKSIPVVLHLNVLRRHGHSGPMKESSNLDYRIGDSIDYRDKNDPINILYARMKKSGYSSSQLDDLTKKLSKKYTSKLNSIKKTINVRK